MAWTAKIYKQETDIDLGNIESLCSPQGTLAKARLPLKEVGNCLLKTANHLALRLLPSFHTSEPLFNPRQTVSNPRSEYSRRRAVIGLLCRIESFEPSLSNYAFLEEGRDRNHRMFKLQPAPLAPLLLAPDWERRSPRDHNADVGGDNIIDLPYRTSPSSVHGRITAVNFNCTLAVQQYAFSTVVGMACKGTERSRTHGRVEVPGSRGPS
ncbi:hypothetical protein SODALDRAFT_360792 [Sodiomyces alkalinus F11]|uniref:Uncharacterized protein n=1 Tax=Sodiomyces alkalinus (strain CBS 110278 / VKM F-3762 / F11) TaxID=1314773 RepID=A0A3N2PRQ8_SODAK|nr:hypothetical protein SODALDRAFT_360792 [Sodiomyces alkalinus F11]ROT37114.1 hypothetical protein SODALDRAFT_360792 [Sodiomyces alkalinus F11]